MYYKCKHFKIEELVPPTVFDRWGQKAWWFIDQELCKTIDELRELFGASITINNWLWSGTYSQSGYRDNSSVYYNEFSAHSFGKAADMKIKGYTSDVSIQMIMDWKKEGKLEYLTRMELATDGWVHVDVFNAEPNNDDQTLYVFNP